MKSAISSDYFRMNNNIFDLETDENGKTKAKLSAIQMQVLAALYSLVPFKQELSIAKSVFDSYKVKVRQSVLAQKCGCSVSTIKRTVEELIRKGYIEAKIRCEYIKDNKKLLGTYTYFLPKIAQKGYFYVNHKALALLSKTQTRVYLFICKCIDSTRKFKSCWNSFNDIARQLKLQRNSVIKTIKELVELKVISKLHNTDIRFKNLYYDNLYCVSTSEEINYCEESLSKEEEYLKLQEVFDEFVETEPAEIKKEELPPTSDNSSLKKTNRLDCILSSLCCQEFYKKIRHYEDIFFLLYALPP